MDLAVQLRYTEATDNVIKSFPTSNVNNYNRTQTNTTADMLTVAPVVFEDVTKTLTLNVASGGSSHTLTFPNTQGVCTTLCIWESQSV